MITEPGRMEAETFVAETDETHEVMCAWCRGEYVEPGPPKNVEGGYISHGICQRCSDKIAADLAALKLSASTRSAVSDPTTSYRQGRE